MIFKLIKKILLYELNGKQIFTRYRQGVQITRASQQDVVVER